ncbi:MAG: hypothetical protein DMF49_07595 [Acidobacteria bacterium]|nr:MAG: hypothetical protein DMF49_07595 [Acidobacteriota bacterium]
MQMQEGFVPDVGQNDRFRRTRWTEGRPEKTLFGGLKVKGRRQLDTVTFRCPRCGWLIWFAPELPGSDE